MTTKLFPNNILVIEASATLRHLLGKQLAGDDYKVHSIGLQKEGLEALTGYIDQQPEYDFNGLILGWSGEASPSLKELLNLLTSPECRHLVVLILTLEADKEKLAWVTHRGASALLIWDDYRDATSTLQKLMVSSVPKPKPSHPKPIPGSTGEEAISVLFVDDSPTVRALMSRLLRNNGYYADTAFGVEDALDKAWENEYDIAIIDYFMPDGNGDELCRQLRSDPRTTNIMVAIFTGTYLDEVIKDSLDAGASECMFKNEADELFLARVAAMSRNIRNLRAMAKESKRLEGILSSVGDGVYGVNRSGHITFINPAARSILGYVRDNQLVGKAPLELFHFAHADGTPNNPETCFLQQAYSLGDELDAWETTFWHASGKAIPVECTVYPFRSEGRLEGSVVAFRDISGHKLMEEELKWQVNHDHLTKLLNRHFFDEELKKEVWRLKRSNKEYSALLYIDLDRFKYINDTAGHSAGDQLLINIGKLLSSRLRSTDMLARLGGDEFAVILRKVPPAKVMELANQFRSIIHDYVFDHQGTRYQVGGSIGIALIGRETKTPDEALANADIACHIAKEQGRNVVHLYNSDSDQKVVMDMELGWSARLREALENDGFRLHFQPILSLPNLDLDTLPRKEGALLEETIVQKQYQPSHYEVLIRMAGRDGQLIYPNAFLPTAERFSMITEIDRWVLRNTIKQLSTYNAKGHQAHFGINLSGQTLGEPGISEYVRNLFTKYKVNPSHIIFEVTETSAISNMDAAKEIIADLSSIGCHFALDDFGCGFSSFSHLKHLKVSYIKIDGMFVQGMVNDPIDQAMVRSMSDIAHSLDKYTVAEFVENFDQLEMLQEFGVDYVQGYLVGKPGDGYL